MRADIHSHLLPGVDDGTRHFAESEKILGQLLEDGLTHLAFTPHFYPAHDSVGRFLARREASLERMKDSPLLERIRFTCGAEVYMTEALFNHEGIERLCYTGTRLILTELEYGVPYGRSVEHKLERLINDFSLVPVLAHIERFPFLLNDPARVAYLREMGCLCQVNLQGFGGFWTKRKMFQLVREDLVDFLGQDLHRDAIPAGAREKILLELEKAAPGFTDRCDAFSRDVIFK